MYDLVGRGGPPGLSTTSYPKSCTATSPPPPAPPGDPLATVPGGREQSSTLRFTCALELSAVEKAVRGDTERYTAAECQDAPGAPEAPKFLRQCLWDCIGVILETLRTNLEASFGW